MGSNHLLLRLCRGSIGVKCINTWVSHYALLYRAKSHDCMLTFVGLIRCEKSPLFFLAQVATVSCVAPLVDFTTTW